MFSEEEGRSEKEGANDSRHELTEFVVDQELASFHCIEAIVTLNKEQKEMKSVEDERKRNDGG